MLIGIFRHYCQTKQRGKIKVNFNTRQAMEQNREKLFMLYGKVLRKHITSIWGWNDTWQRNDFDGHFKPQQNTSL
jgi:hypothetical protein